METDPPLDRETWHVLRIEEAVAAVGSNASAGLAPADVARRLERFGPNALAETPPRTRLAVFASQFKSPLIYLLLLAAVIAAAVGEIGDAIVILVVVVLNAAIGAFQEGRAERSLRALRKLALQKARVLRAGREEEIAAREIVPGDVLLLAAGDAVTADARLLEGASLQISEAALTGESLPVAKDLLPLAPDTPLADRRNMVYAGTHVTAGRARALVVATGPATEIGRIADLAESTEPPKTPLENRVDGFGRGIIIAAGLLFVAIIGLGLLRQVPLGSILMIGISQVVGIIPEGLPVAMTIALAVGVQRMARRGALVRRLAAVETLGSTTVICTDKTGTLTKNEMTVTAVWLPDGRELDVSGTGFAPEGGFTEGDEEISAESDAPLRALLEAGVLCNDAHLAGPDEADPRWRALGDPTEAALLTAAVKAGLVPSELRAHAPRRAEIPFDSGEKMMATQHGTTTSSRVVLKGASEAILDLCGSVHRGSGDASFDDSARHAARAAAERMAARGLRVLAIAIAPGTAIEGWAGFAAFRGRATLLGLVGESDPPRPQAEEAVARCRAAGIRTVMVTGDHKATGMAIARTLGILRDGDVALDGRELDRLGDGELAAVIPRVAVFARVHPAQKLRIVNALRSRNEVVAMTGDGVNDAPALASADVGVAMGITGTDVAKEAAKIVVTDDDFATIVAAVEEGRVVYRNIKKAILLLVATSMAEVAILLIALALGYPPPFTALQILWNNLVTEGLITVNLVLDPAEGEEMARAPIPRDEPLLSRALLARMAVMTPAIVLSTLGWFIARLNAGLPLATAQTEAFTLLVVCEWFNVLNCRSETRTALSAGIFRNPWLIGGLVAGNLLQIAVVYWRPLGGLFHTVPFGAAEAVGIAVAASLVLWLEELRKLAARGRRRRASRRQASAAA